VREVAGSTPLFVASFTEVFDEFDPAAIQHLFLNWTPVSTSTPTKLRAYGLRRRQHYRMDAERAPGTTSYVWPASLLGNLSISRDFLGVVAWNSMERGGAARRIYVPLRIGVAASNKRNGSYELILVPAAELTEVYVSLALTNDTGKPVRQFKNSEALGYGYYPPYRGIRIPLSGLTQPGIYVLKVDAQQRDKGTSNTEAWFYHAM
jgi:hypothetical protein